MKKVYYLHQSNGDYNSECHGMGDLCGLIDFELNTGCQDYLIITKRQIDSNMFGSLVDVFRLRELERQNQELREGIRELREANENCVFCKS